MRSIATSNHGLAPRVDTAVGNEVVAVVLMWRGRIGLFKRSQAVGHDRGLWHCITGYVDDPDSEDAPLHQGLLELYEETGLGVTDLDAFDEGPTLHLRGPSGSWLVHTFAARTTQRRLSLNWEHDAYRWVKEGSVRRFEGQVDWLTDVLRAVADCGASTRFLARDSDGNALRVGARDSKRRHTPDRESAHAGADGPVGGNDR